MKTKMTAHRLEFYLRRSDERNIRNRSMGLNLSGTLPLLTVKVYREAADRRKRHAAEIYPLGQSRLYHEAGNLSEYAFHKLLLAKRIPHSWVEYSLEPLDFMVDYYGSIGVTSQRHRTYLKFEHNPVVHYPIRRLHTPSELPDYVLATSVFTLRSHEVLVAFWGMISRDRLIEVMRHLWGNRPIPTENQFVAIPLAEFEPEPLARLLNPDRPR